MANDAFYSLTATSALGTAIPFLQYKGRVVLIVNVASLCGYSPQYTELQNLYDSYDRLDFDILAFPSNQFGNQEPGDDVYTENYTRQRFKVSFPITQKVLVNGRGQHPVYAYLKSQRTGILGFRGIRWNFEKFLVDRKGAVVRRYPSFVSPKDFASDVDALVKQA